jgi:hypothetical protein
MRITRDTLLKIARDTASQRAHQDHNLVCVYLTGSVLLEEDPLLGGTADVDLVCVHAQEPASPREVVRLSDEVHLDIAHYSQSIFARPRELRMDPWIGGFLCQKTLLLYEIQHWFEFTQASVCAQYNLPEMVLRRSRPLAESARQTWMQLSVKDAEPQPEILLSYLRALEQAANAIACLKGLPLTERRLVLDFPVSAEAVNRPGLASGLVDLFMPQAVTAENWENWVPAWQTALTACAHLPGHPVRLDAARIPYYLRAATSLVDEQPAASVWLLLRTWTLAETLLSANSATKPAWQEVCQAVGLGADQLHHQLDSLDAYLDGVEETLDEYANKNGIPTSGG